MMIRNLILILYYDGVQLLEGLHGNILAESIHLLLSILIIITSSLQADSNPSGDALDTFRPNVLIKLLLDTNITVSSGRKSKERIKR
jgi:hypothetical protein